MPHLLFANSGPPKFALAASLLKRSLLVLLPLLATILFSARSNRVFAQSFAEISGTIRDSNQAPLPGVRITITNQATRSESIVYTGKDGFYLASGLEPALCDINAFRTGFQTVARHDLNLSTSSRLRLDLEMVPVQGTWQMPQSGTLAYMFLAALVPALVAILLTEPGKKVLQSLGGCGRWIGDKFYESLAARFPKWIGVPGYEKRVARSDLAKIDHPVGPGDSDNFTVALEQAFAPVAVMTGEGEDRIDLFPFAALHRRFLVLGGPGTGKTTLMKSLIVAILKRRCDAELNSLTPVFVVLREMSAADQSVEQAIVAALGKLRFRRAGRFVESALDAGRLLVILDGLDEVGARRAEVSGKIRDFCRGDEQRDRQNRVIVTCRENSYRSRDLADVIATTTRVEPFAPQHMRTFLQGWPPYKGRVALKLYSQLQADSQILDICRNPLMLTLLTGLYLEKDKFDLPSSREAFYFTAIDELLLQRPARKQQRQVYSDQQKWPILQRIALDRLETVRPEDDPEVLSRDRLRDFAKEVLGGDLKEAEFQILLDELDAVNSVVKPSGEGGYVFVHRTFQEYFAAKEAHRTRKTSQVLFRFAGRPELTEALCFYCALIKNIPTINTTIEKLLNSEDALLAARCLANVTEAPSEGVIEKVVDSLFEAVRKSKNFAVELDLLSSLAQRRPTEFDAARRRFSDVIGLVTSTAGDGSSGFISAISADPARAMQLVPGLLQHESAKWRTQAVLLLHNLGTLDALQQLVELVDAGGAPERAWAAVSVSNLVKARNFELRRMEALLKDRPPDDELWPFGKYFPSRIAIAIVTALESDALPADAIRNTCIAVAVNRRRRVATSWWDRLRWRNVASFMALNSWKRSAAKVVAYALVILVGASFVLQVGLRGVDTIMQRMTLIQLWPPRVVITSNRSVVELQTAASALYADIEGRYPPTTSGFARVLPWNWEVKPSVPPESKQAIDELNELSMLQDPLRDIPWEVVHDGLSRISVSAGALSSFDNAEAAWTKIPTVQSRRLCLSVVGERRGWGAAFGFLVAIVIAPAYVLFFAKRLAHRGELLHTRYLSFVAFAPAALSNTFLAKHVFISVVVTFFIVLLIEAGSRIDFPPNPYMALARELGPISGEELVESDHADE